MTATTEVKTIQVSAVDKAALAVRHATARDKSRPALTYVSIHDGHSAAANGFMAAMADLAKTEAPEGATTDPSGMINRDLAAQIGRNASNAAWFDQDGRLVWRQGATELAATLPTDITFPDMKKLMSDWRASKSTGYVWLDLDLIAAAVTTIREFLGTSVRHVKFALGGDKHKPIILTAKRKADDREIVIVIMPLWKGDDTAGDGE